MMSRTPPRQHAVHTWIAWLWIALAAGLTLAFAGVMVQDRMPWLRGPAPYPPEWEWLYQPLAWTNQATWIHLAIFVLYPIVALVLLHPTWIRWSTAQTRQRSALALAVLFFFGSQLVLTWSFKGHLLNDFIWHTYEPPGNGYFMSAVRVEDFWAAIHDYATAMTTFPHHRPMTHPPGIFLFYSAFIDLFRHTPEFNQWFAAIARTWAPPEHDWVLLADRYVPAAFFSGLGRWLLAGFAPLAFYAFLRRLEPNKEPATATFALWGALLLPLLPAVSSFYSHWDVNYLLLASGAWFFALRGQDRLHADTPQGSGRWLDWIWAGLLLGLLTWLSFGNAVICAIVGLHILWREVVTLGVQRGGLAWPRLGRFALGGLLTTGAVVLPWLLAYVFWGMNYFDLLATGMRMHFELVTAARDFSIWRWMNLVDYAVWVGPGVLLLGIVGSIWLVFHLRRGALESSLAGMALVVWSIILLLNQSGTTRGEIGRLWIFLMPYPLLFALGYLRSYWQRAALLGMLALGAWALGYALRIV